MDNSRSFRRRYRAYLHGELEAAGIYTVLAEAQGDPQRVQVFQRLIRAEMRHATLWAQKLGIDPGTLRPARRGLRLWLLKLAIRLLGTRRVLPVLIRGEVRDGALYSQDPEAREVALEERRHGGLLHSLAGARSPLDAVRGEIRHWVGGGGTLRAAILGANDGLVSNFSLVMGVAGGTGEPKFVLLAGVAGMLAGAFSMAVGEYVSMKAQRELYLHQLRKERDEIEQWPEEEERELTVIYESKGLSRDEAQTVARKIMVDPDLALDTMAREELGLDPSQLGSPWGASVSSFLAFGSAALIPTLPYIFRAGRLAFSLSASLSAVALLVVGATTSWMAGRSPAWGSVRMFLAGSAASSITFGVGHLVGVSLLS